ncbi:MAG: 7-carboxy-7-deazaguanine synthase QueE [Bdellovibrionota bacterium]|nr:7-carboxy-7-deazaguanine synthase QueE [Bdellovibrionota bacterium]
MQKLNFTKDYHFFTVQGEGLHTGRPAIFLRLSGCNLRCEWLNSDGSTSLCDTPYSSHQPEKLLKSIDDIVEDIKSYPCKYVVITGGEPYLQKAIAPFISELKNLGYYVCIETNASIYFETEADFISMSPKLSTSCVDKSENFESHQKRRKNIEALASFTKQHDFQFKFVINCKDDLLEAKEMIAEIEAVTAPIAKDKILLMPQAVTKKQLEEKSEQVIEWAMEFGYSFCDRMHIRIWNDKRGV